MCVGVCSLMCACVCVCVCVCMCLQRCPFVCEKTKLGGVCSDRWGGSLLPRKKNPYKSTGRANPIDGDGSVPLDY